MSYLQISRLTSSFGGARIIVELRRNPEEARPKWHGDTAHHPVTVTSYEWEKDERLHTFNAHDFVFLDVHHADMSLICGMHDTLKSLRAKWSKLQDQAGYASQWEDCVRRMQTITGADYIEVSPELFALAFPERAKHNPTDRKVEIFNLTKIATRAWESKP